MNDKQRLFVMVGTGSLLVLLITIFGLGFGSHSWYDTSEVDTSVERWIRETGLKLKETTDTEFPIFKEDGKVEKRKTVGIEDKTAEYKTWKNNTAEKERVERTEIGLPLLFKKDGITNWFGIIACFNIAVCSVGFVLFKDK